MEQGELLTGQKPLFEDLVSKPSSGFSRGKGLELSVVQLCNGHDQSRVTLADSCVKEGAVSESQRTTLRFGSESPRLGGQAVFRGAFQTKAHAAE
jgi:hypothetical protein